MAKWDKSQPGNSQPSSLVGTCLTLPNLGFLWAFLKYPKISKNGREYTFYLNTILKKKRNRTLASWKSNTSSSLHKVVIAWKHPKVALFVHYQSISFSAYSNLLWCQSTCSMKIDIYNSSYLVYCITNNINTLTPEVFTFRNERPIAVHN